MITGELCEDKGNGKKRHCCVVSVDSDAAASYKLGQQEEQEIVIGQCNTRVVIVECALTKLSFEDRHVLTNMDNLITPFTEEGSYYLSCSCHAHALCQLSFLLS